MEKKDIRDILRQGFAEQGLTDKIDPWVLQNLDYYCQLLLEKNQVMSLRAWPGCTFWTAPPC